MALQRPVILMRPGEANNRLAGVLLKEGIECWRWPAFRIELPGKEDCDLVQERLDNLDDVEMVILPSPASVAAAAHWVKAWPEHITLATVGEGTAKVIRAAWGDDVKLIYPEGDAEDSGSEALWEILKHRGAPSRVLFLRGQTGREWLPEQLRSIGSDVITMCIYVRSSSRPNSAATSSWPPTVRLRSSTSRARTPSTRSSMRSAPFRRCATG